MNYLWYKGLFVDLTFLNYTFNVYDQNVKLINFLLQ